MRGVALVLVALAVAGCTGPAPGIIVVGSTWRATVTTVPGPPRGITPHRLIVTFNGPQVQGPVRLRMRMPGMSHEGTTTSLRAAGPGRYEGTVTFEMAGTWELALLVGNPAQAAAASLVVQP